MNNEPLQVGGMSQTPRVADDSETTTINLLPYVKQLLRGRLTVLLFAAAGTFIGVVSALLAAPRYTAQAAFLPPGEVSSSGAISAQIGALGGSGLFGSSRSPAYVYAGLLRSQTVLGLVVDRFHLKDVYHTPFESNAERALAKATTIDVGLRDSIVTVQVVARSPYLARDIANGYLDAIQTMNGNLALSDASARRAFFKTQLENEKDQLANAEVELRKTQEQTGLILPASQATLQIDTIARTRAEIAGREVQLAALRQSSTDLNPDVIRLKSEIADLQGQLAGMEHGKESLGNVPTSQVPKLELESVRKEREVKYHEALFDIIAKQYESARLDESKSGPTVQIIDHASLPDVKSGPSRMLMVIAGLAVGVFTGLVAVLLMANFGRLRRWANRNFGDAHASA